MAAVDVKQNTVFSVASQHSIRAVCVVSEGTEDVQKYVLGLLRH